MTVWFTGSRIWFTLKALVSGAFGHVNQDFCLISKNVCSDLRFSAGSLPPPYRGMPLVNQAIPPGGQGTQNQHHEGHRSGREPSENISRLTPTAREHLDRARAALAAAERHARAERHGRIEVNTEARKR